MKDQTTITCPDCGSSIDVNDILKHQLEDGIRKEFQNKFAEQAKHIKIQEEALIKEKEELGEQIEQAKIGFEKSIRIELKKKLELEHEESMKAIQEELQEKSDKVKELYAKDAEIEKLKREKGEAEAKAKLEAQKEINKLLQIERDKIKQESANENELKIKELEKKLKDQIDLTEQMKRKQEQGSMQLQGEIQELAIEEWLITQFPLDTIEEIKKGANGADCLQVINTRSKQNCGTIYYESKRTKNFSNTWIEKFKNDIREKNANIGVLVTEVLPSDMDRMGLKDGIWICSYEEFKGLCAVLRESIINISNTLVSQENKGDKMVMLYDFLTSNEFRLQIEGIVEGFTQMKTDLNKEKTAMINMWTKREKQIDKVINNTVSMHGSIKGIAGAAIQEIKMLELDE